MLSLFRDLFCVGVLAFPSPAFRLEIDEYDYFLNWIEIAAVVLPHFDHLLSKLAPIGWQLEFVLKP